MLLRVDIYPHDQKIDGTENDKKELDPDSTIYVSLNTSTSSTILTVGRKDATIVLPNDKSVSRQHASIMLLSNREMEEVEEKSLPGKAESDEELEACQNCLDGIVAVLKDTSRFGTFLVTEGKGKQDKKANDTDCTGDDETDDEGGISQQQHQSQLSAVSTRLMKEANQHTVVKVEKQIILKDLSLQSGGRVLVQCGQNGTTLVLSRVPLNVALSRVPKATKDVWAKRAPILGLTLMDTLTNHLTHLVAPQRITNAKSLVTWCLQKPMVTPAYLDALWEMTSAPTTNLPDPADFFSPPGDDETFWNEIPNPRLWKHCTLLSHTKGDDMESLCRAAGSKIVALYSEDSSANATQKLIDKALAKGRKGFFYINTTSKTHGKTIKYLKQNQVTAVTQKIIAYCVSKQEPLTDNHNNLIGTPSNQEESFKAVHDDANDDAVNIEKNKVKNRIKHVVEENDDNFVSRKTEMRPKPPELSERISSSDRNELLTKVRNMSETEKHPQTKNNCKERSQGRDSQGSATQLDHNQKRSESVSPPEQTGQGSSSISMERVQEGLEHPREADESNISETPSRKRGRTDKNNDPDESDPKKMYADKKCKLDTNESSGWTQVRKRNEYEDEGFNDKNSDEDVEEFSARQVLGKSNDGWLVAAPAGDRKKFMATEAELLNVLEDVDHLLPVAETDVVETLVVEAKSQRRSQSRNSSIVDFKGFRKNLVMQIDSTEQIQMRVVLPQQSDRQVELQEEQAQLEANLREADRLFSDRSNNIASHFKPRKRVRARNV